MDSLLRLLDGISQDAAMLEFVKAQEDWEIDGSNAVEPRVVKRPSIIHSSKKYLTLCTSLYLNCAFESLFMSHDNDFQVPHICKHMIDNCNADNKMNLYSGGLATFIFLFQ